MNTRGIGRAGWAALILSAGCQAAPVVVLDLRTNLPEGAVNHVNYIDVEVRAPPNPDRSVPDEPPALASGTYPLFGPNGFTLPGRVVVEIENGITGKLDVHVIARQGSRPQVRKTARIDVVRDNGIPIPVDIDQDCLNILCPRERTCMSVPGYGGVCVKTDPPINPPFYDGGEVCKCPDLFPICVGASWTYNVIQNGVPEEKTWKIASYEEMHDSRNEKFNKKAFLQVRAGALLFTHKWISIEDDLPPGKRVGKLFWEKEDAFDTSVSRVSTTYFVTKKVRVLADLTGEHEESYTQLHVRPRLPLTMQQPTLESVARDKWQVLEPVELKAMKMRPNFPALFRDSDKVVCHRRIGTQEVLSGEPPEGFGRPTERIFCYVPSVGKVYELDTKPPPILEEVLTRHTIPRCPHLNGP